MEIALNEVKIQAKRLLKWIKLNSQLPAMNKKHLIGLPSDNIDAFKLKHCLIITARKLGFKNWHHCQQILQGTDCIPADLDMGTIFHTSRCDVFINQWFATYNEAKILLDSQPKSYYLLPYKKQFVVVKKQYLKELGVTDDFDNVLNELNFDLYHSYNSIVWDKLAAHIIKIQSEKAQPN